MSKLNNRCDFFDWLETVTYLLPPKMTVHEAKLLYERKEREEQEIQDEKNSPP
jgi:hypothetical protein